MVFPSLFSLILILVLTILFTVLKIVILKRSSLEALQKLPPGPPKLPLIGNIHQLVSKSILPHRRLAELARTYGPIMHLQLGEVPTIIISSADVAREVMKIHDATFCSRPNMLIAKELCYNYTDIGMAPYGEYWRQVRKISSLELFTHKRVDSFRTIREEETSNLIDSISPQVGSIVNLSKKLFDLTSVITTRITCNTKCKEDLDALRAIVARVSQVSSGLSVVDLYPSLEWLQSISGMKERIQDLIKDANKVLDPIIEEHKCKKRHGNNNEEEVFVDVLLKFHQDNINTNEFSLTSDNIKGIISDLYGAGTETPSTLMEWSMSEMLKNPRVMDKAQDEVRRVYQEQEVVDETKVDELKYLKLVIKETLRLHPPLTLLIPRESINRCQIQGYEIPSKTRVFINVWAIGRDPKYWCNPDRFIPERFEKSSVDYKEVNFEYIPFGAGRRRCPGITLAITQVLLPLAKLLYHFDWKLPSTIKRPEDLDMDESFALTTRRKNDLLVIPLPYSGQNFI